MTGTDGSAWNNPVKGAEIAKSQQSQKADVIYAAAGGTGVGVLQAAADMNILSIGVDSDQNYLHPGQVLTSMVKRVDNAVYAAFKEGADIKPGVSVMDLKAGGVDVAMDENNAKLVTPEMKKAVDDAAAKIKSGDLKVHDYMADNSCPAGQF
jgi:basic membrane protein A